MEVLKSYEWNGHQYHNVRLDDGSVIEMKCSVADLESKVSAIPKDSPNPPGVNPQEISDADLLDEIKRRKLAVIVKGEAK